MQFDRAKLKTVVLYACARCEPSQLGAVKLHKVLYFADMLHYAQVGTPLTGATYRKRPHGPTCDNLLPTLRELAQEGSLDIRETDYFGYRKKEYVALREPDLSRLNEDEVSLVNEMISFVCFQHTAKTISEFSHNRAWEMADFGDILPYDSVFLLFPTQVSIEALEWASAQAPQIEAQRSQSHTLGDVDYASFRGRFLPADGAL